MSLAINTVRHAALVCASAFALLQSEGASASLMTFEIQTGMELGCGACNGFEEETGFVKGTGSYEVTSRFTIDTEAAVFRQRELSRTYLFDQPGTGMEVMVGRLIIKYDIFQLTLLDDASGCDWLFVFTDPVEGGAVFNTGNCSAPRLPDYSLATFAKTDLSVFSGTGFDTAVFSPNHSDEIDWWLQGGVTSIRRVPEPGSLALFALGLAGLALTRRRRHTA